MTDQSAYLPTATYAGLAAILIQHADDLRAAAS